MREGLGVHVARYATPPQRGQHPMEVVHPRPQLAAGDEHAQLRQCLVAGDVLHPYVQRPVLPTALVFAPVGPVVAEELQVK